MRMYVFNWWSSQQYWSFSIVKANSIGIYQKIELITNPSAKYNPEGMSGINIVLHKNATDGFNASINTGLTFARTPKISNSTNMNYRTGKVNFFFYLWK
jgi:hypothetical protein